MSSSPEQRSCHAAARSSRRAGALAGRLGEAGRHLPPLVLEAKRELPAEQPALSDEAAQALLAEERGLAPLARAVRIPSLAITAVVGAHLLVVTFTTV